MSIACRAILSSQISVGSPRRGSPRGPRKRHSQGAKKYSEGLPPSHAFGCRQFSLVKEAHGTRLTDIIAVQLHDACGQSGRNLDHEGETIMKEFGVGILGTGWVAGSHIQAFEANPHTEVRAILSRDRDRAASKAAEHKLAHCRAYDHLKDLL